MAPPDDVERHERIVELRTARDRRPQPARDDKVVTVWNALAITALAEAGIGLHRTEWVQRAAWCAGELLDRHIVDGQLRRASLDGAVGEPVAMLDDHAALVVALLSLYCATGEQRWRTAARPPRPRNRNLRRRGRRRVRGSMRQPTAG